MTLRGRVAAAASDMPDGSDAEFSLLLCARVPIGGASRPDASAADLLRRIPPAELWGAPPAAAAIGVNGARMMTNQYGMLEPGTGASAAAFIEPVASGTASAPERMYRLPYDLLVTPDEARLVMAGAAPRHLSSDLKEEEAPAVCNAHVRLPKKRKGRDGDEWDAFWREKVAAMAGQWAAVTVEVQRYSFPDPTPRGRARQRVGTRLVLKNIEAAARTDASGAGAAAPAI